MWVRFAIEAGIPALEKLLETLGGNKVHIPKLRSFWAPRLAHLRNEELRARYNGANIPQLALEYGISQRMVRKILRVRRRHQLNR